MLHCGYLTADDHPDQPQKVRGFSPAIAHDEYQPPKITIGDVELKSTQHFTYLACIISHDSRIDKENNNRLSTANSSLGGLYKHAWSNKILLKMNKIGVYKVIGLITLPLGPVTWVTCRKHSCLFERFH